MPQKYCRKRSIRCSSVAAGGLRSRAVGRTVSLLVVCASGLYGRLQRCAVELDRVPVTTVRRDNARENSTRLEVMDE